jgi:methionine-gamma-lyase
MHECVEDVRYPSLPGCDPRGLLGRQMKGPGAMIAFTVRGGHEAAAAVMRSVMLATPAVSLGACDTLIQHPAGLTHRVVDAKALADEGITPGMLRLSVGLEDVEDLWQDLDGSLRASVRKAEMMGVGAL